MKVDIKELENIKDLLDDIEFGNPLVVDEAGEDKYVIMQSEQYAEMQEALYNSVAGNANMVSPSNVKVIGLGHADISEEDLEDLKKELSAFVQDYLTNKFKKSTLS